MKKIRNKIIWISWWITLILIVLIIFFYPHETLKVFSPSGGVEVEFPSTAKIFLILIIGIFNISLTISGFISSKKPTTSNKVIAFVGIVMPILIILISIGLISLEQFLQEERFKEIENEENEQMKKLLNSPDYFHTLKFEEAICYPYPHSNEMTTFLVKVRNLDDQKFITESQSLYIEKCGGYLYTNSVDVFLPNITTEISFNCLRAFEEGENIRLLLRVQQIDSPEIYLGKNCIVKNNP